MAGVTVGQYPRQNNWMDEASRVFGVPLKKHTMEKAVGPCPYCHCGVDRFVVWSSGNGWCNQCHQTGWWLPVEDGRKAIAEQRVAHAQQQQVLRAQMATCQDWQRYHVALYENGGGRIALWCEQGFSEDEMQKWGLGWCAVCPCAPESASLTIPVFHKQALIDIRHRLIGAAQGNKYRSHVAGLSPAVFNADALRAADTVIVVEGEKKAILGVRAGFPATLGLPGAQFGEALLDVLVDLDARQRVILALDPGQAATAERLALAIGSAARVADFPTKPDDFLLRYGATAYAEVIKQARRVLPKKG